MPRKLVVVGGKTADSTLIHEQIPRKGELEKLCSRHALSQEGCAWFKAALDPFHDFDIPYLDGYPDSYSGTSLVAVSKVTHEISKDPGLGAGNWDCHIANMPSGDGEELRAAQFDLASGTGSNVGIDTTTYTQHFCTSTGFTATIVSQSLSGVNTFDPELACAAVRTNFNDIVPISNTIEAGANDSVVRRARVIAGGMQVVNTTKATSLQGRVLCYAFDNVPTEHLVKAYDLNTGLIGQGMVPARLWTLPPKSLDEAQQMKETVAWGAEEGVYMPFQLNREPEVTCKRSQAVGYTPYASGFTPSSDGLFVRDFIQPLVYDAVAGNSKPNQVVTDATTEWGSNSLDHPFRSHGAYFHGLDADTTLSLTVIHYIEIWPTHDQLLVRLANPSAPRDDNAVQLYNLVKRQLPIAVPVGMNPLGEWFGAIGKAARDLAPALAVTAKQLPFLQPLSQGLDRAISLGEDIGDALDNPRRRRRRKTIKNKARS